MRRISLALLAALLVFATKALAVPSLAFHPMTQTRPLGSQATVEVVLTGSNVGDFDLVVSYAANIVALSSAAFGTMLGDPLDPTETITAETPGTDAVALAEVSLLAPSTLLALQGAGPVTLFTLIFDTLAVGTSPLMFTLLDIGDENGLRLVDLQVNDGSITVSEVPEPTTAALLATGLLGLLSYRRRHRQKSYTG
jgi:hypothetical protein